ncbi:MAG: hypothetical protein HYX72_03425 [Acidobacteria bacterium]|nr:hypothetical protein [Acidobacteriota bacterium]
MNTTVIEAEELRHMRETVSRTVNLLELCWGCDRVCECEQWVANESVPVWLCIECLSEVACRLETSSGPVSLPPT